MDDALPPSVDEIERIATETVAAFPAPFLSHARKVELIVEDWPEGKMLDDLRIENAYGLTGLYEGVPMTEKAEDNPFVHPDRVYLFRRPILDEWVARGDIGLAQLVAHVVIHEFAHHFGWSDTDIATIAPWQ